jgi:hypothetical protein
METKFVLKLHRDDRMILHTLRLSCTVKLAQVAAQAVVMIAQDAFSDCTNGPCKVQSPPTHSVLRLETGWCS